MMKAIEKTLVSVPLDDTVQATDNQISTVIDLNTRLYQELGSARGLFVLLRPDRFVAAGSGHHPLHRQLIFGAAKPRNGAKLAKEASDGLGELSA